MARALECPACGAWHRLDTLPESPTFRCGQCGQSLRVPTAVSSDPAAPPPPSRTGAPAPVAPPRRRRPPDAAPGESPTRVAPAAVSATVAAAPPDERDARTNGRGRAPAPTPPTKRRRVALYWRLLAWVVAVPLGFLLTAWPAYELGFIAKDDLLDIFVGTGVGRYLRLGIVTFVWALVTALLVQLFVEGGRVRAARRRRARAAAA